MSTDKINPPGYEDVKFIIPDLPSVPFMLAEQNDPSIIGPEGPWDADDFSIDPETNTMLSIPEAGHWTYWRVISQIGNELTMVDGEGLLHEYKIVSLPDNVLPVEGDSEPIPGTPDNPLEDPNG